MSIILNENRGHESERAQVGMQNVNDAIKL